MKPVPSGLTVTPAVAAPAVSVASAAAEAAPMMSLRIASFGVCRQSAVIVVSLGA
jgi:hypothetical protein